MNGLQSLKYLRQPLKLSPLLETITKRAQENYKIFINLCSNALDTGGQGWLAHPHYDREGNLYNFSVKQKPTSRYDVIKIPMRPESTETEPFKGISS